MLTKSKFFRTIRFKFHLYLGTAVTVFVAIVFVWLYRQTAANVMAQIDAQAKFLLQQVVLTRAWVADHGGLFVSKQPGKETNPFLPDTDLVDKEGNVYLYRNPAMVTREISEYAESAGLYKFRLSSLKLRNTANEPTPYEREALLEFQKMGFEKSKDGKSSTGLENGATVYQRIIPLMVEESCLECHDDQDYSAGDVRGALSVIIPMSDSLATIENLRNKLVFSFVGLIFLVSGILYYLLKKVVLKPVDHLHHIAMKLVGGDTFERAELSTGDEFEDLGYAFNKMTDRLNTGYEGAIKALIAAVEAKDPYTKGHTARVARYAAGIAREMNLPDKVVQEVELGAVLHDIGKIGVADDVLTKTEPLVGEEKKQMEAHVKKGVEIIHNADFLFSAIPAIQYHHERPDGTGYPDGIRGEQLPLISAIIAVADSFDAMTTDRPYRSGMAKAAAIDEIAKQAGKQFDQKVVSAFIRAMDSPGQG